MHSSLIYPLDIGLSICSTVGETKSLVNGCPFRPEARKLVQIDIFLFMSFLGPVWPFSLFALTITTSVLISCELKNRDALCFFKFAILLLLISVNIPSFGSLEFDKYVFALFKYVFAQITEQTRFLIISTSHLWKEKQTRLLIHVIFCDARSNRGDCRSCSHVWCWHRCGNCSRLSCPVPAALTSMFDIPAEQSEII